MKVLAKTESPNFTFRVWRTASVLKSSQVGQNLGASLLVIMAVRPETFRPNLFDPDLLSGMTLVDPELR